jgi:hypothetical protein
MNRTRPVPPTITNVQLTAPVQPPLIGLEIRVDPIAGLCTQRLRIGLFAYFLSNLAAFANQINQHELLTIAPQICFRRFPVCKRPRQMSAIFHKYMR